MAAGRHNLTRRQVLGAAAGACAGAVTRDCPHLRDSHSLTVPTSIRGQLPATVPNSSWTRAFAAFRRADARVAAFRAWEETLPPAARAFPASQPLEERCGALESARLAVLRRLLRATAPDLPALALKITLAIDDEIAFFPGGDRCLAAVKADALRLCHG